MSFPVILTEVNNSNGGISKNISRCRGETPGIGNFTQEQLLVAFDLCRALRTKTGIYSTALVDRTWNTYAGRTKYESHVINSGLKILDAQAKRSGGFMTGNVYSNTQYSSYIRSELQTECGGRENAVGHLRNFDINTFQKFQNYPGYRNFIDVLNRDHSRCQEQIGYAVFHTNAACTPATRMHGWVITKADSGELVEVIRVNSSMASYEVMERAIAAFTMSTLQKPEPLLLIKGGLETYVAPELEVFYVDELARRASRVQAEQPIPAPSEQAPVVTLEQPPVAPTKRSRPRL